MQIAVDWFYKTFESQETWEKAVKNIKNITGKVSGCALIFGKWLLDGKVSSKVSSLGIIHTQILFASHH